MNQIKKLSIIIISKNEEKNIGKLLHSIKLQRFPVPYELILSDNDSKDATVKIAKGYGAEVSKGGLPAAGRNSGAKKATGDLLLFLDADTILPIGFIERNLKEFVERDLALAAVLSRVNTKKVIYQRMYDLGNLFILLSENISPYATGHCIFCPAAIHRKINGFNETLNHGEDFDYAKRAAKQGKFGVLRSVPIITSTRRFEKEGVNKIIIRGLAYLALKNMVGHETAAMFKYDFDYSSPENRKSLPIIKKLRKKLSGLRRTAILAERR